MKTSHVVGVEEEQVTIELPNKLKLTGTKEQVIATAQELGFAISVAVSYYNSESKGMLLIEEMNSAHLRNAILKMHKDWLEGLRNISNPSSFVAALESGVDDLTYDSMVDELVFRDSF